jgi:hypothetical protein
MQVKIYIEVRGGIVQAVYADAHRDVGVKVRVLDYDDLECGDFDQKELVEFQKLEAEVKGLMEVY